VEEKSTFMTWKKEERKQIRKEVEMVMTISIHRKMEKV
jgi:hypothetical protein